VFSNFYKSAGDSQETISLFLVSDGYAPLSASQTASQLTLPCILALVD